MVLTNFECWAHGGNTNGITSVVANSTNRSGMDLFNPRAVSHISSNGYYGFSHINGAAAAAAVAHEQHQDLQNNNINNNNNNNNSISLNQTTTTTKMENNVNAGYSAMRCKKRFYEDGGNNNNNNIDLSAFHNGTTSPATEAAAINAKRCRYDDEATDMAAQYCNDFFSLPMMSQIGTQSCLMDIEDHHHHPQHYQQPQLQVYADEAMTIAHSQSTIPHQTSSATEQLQQQQQQQQHPHHEQQQQQQHNHHQYHHNQHYQGHLHRANRDVSRCMMSHMI